MISGWSLGAALYLPHSFPEDAIPSQSGMTFVSQAVRFRLDEHDRFFTSSKDVRREEILLEFFLAGDSGAHFYIAWDVRDPHQVSWVDPSDPVRDFNDLSISQSEAQSIECSITTGRVLENGKVKILSIIGTGHGLAAETLMGSGLIAGESSAAYDETFTRTLVTVRSVGIGAYSVSLEQRVIQKENTATTILTSFLALNKDIVHDVCLRNDQLGGA